MPALIALAMWGAGLLGLGVGVLTLEHHAQAAEKARRAHAVKRAALLAQRRGQIATFFMSDGKSHTGSIVDTDAELLLVVIDPVKDKKGRRKDLVEVSLLDLDDLSVLSE